MADSPLNAPLAAALRTKVRPLVPHFYVPLSDGRVMVVTSAAQMQDLLDERAEADSHDDWRDLNARPAG